MCGAQLPPSGPGRRSHPAEVSSVELNLYRGEVFQLFVISLIVSVIFLVEFVYLIRVGVSVSTQDYASLSTLYIVVKASLVLQTQTKNMILRAPSTDVSR